MNIDKTKFVSVFYDLAKQTDRKKLPLWDELPDIELYMDQVIFILTKYLDYGGEKPITQSMINNYVNLGTIPPPVRKKYSRIHLAYLFIVFTLKQTLDMATIQRILPVGTDASDTEKIYNSFVRNQNKAYDYITENVVGVANAIF